MSSPVIAAATARRRKASIIRSWRMDAPNIKMKVAGDGLAEQPADLGNS